MFGFISNLGDFLAGFLNRENDLFQTEAVTNT